MEVGAKQSFVACPGHDGERLIGAARPRDPRRKRAPQNETPLRF
jgi:hypothetical protein